MTTIKPLQWRPYSFQVISNLLTQKYENSPWCQISPKSDHLGTITYSYQVASISDQQLLGLSYCAYAYTHTDGQTRSKTILLFPASLMCTIRRQMPTTVLESLIVALVLSRLDYYMDFLQASFSASNPFWTLLHGLFPDPTSRTYHRHARQPTVAACS